MVREDHAWPDISNENLFGHLKPHRRYANLPSCMQNANALKAASPALRADRDYVLGIVKLNGDALKNAAEHLRCDEDVVLTAIAESSQALRHASRWLREDPSFVLQAFKLNHASLRYAPDSLRGDEDFMLEAVEHNRVAFKYFSEELMHNRDFLLRAMSKWPYKDLLAYMPVMYRDDYDFVEECVTINGLTLSSASKELRDEFWIVMAAVKQNGLALQFASPRIKRNREVVLEAVKQNVEAFEFCHWELQKDLKILQIAVEKNPSLRPLLCEEVQHIKTGEPRHDSHYEEDPDWENALTVPSVHDFAKSRFRNRRSTTSMSLWSGHATVATGAITMADRTEDVDNELRARRRNSVSALVEFSDKSFTANYHLSSRSQAAIADASLQIVEHSKTSNSERPITECTTLQTIPEEKDLRHSKTRASGLSQSTPSLRIGRQAWDAPDSVRQDHDHNHITRKSLAVREPPPHVKSIQMQHLRPPEPKLAGLSRGMSKMSRALSFSSKKTKSESQISSLPTVSIASQKKVKVSDHVADAMMQEVEEASTASHDATLSRVSGTGRSLRPETR